MSAEQVAAAPTERRHKLVSLSRILALTMHTFTHLVRMKVFYFLVVFSGILFVTGFVVLQMTPEQELKALKDIAFFFMEKFSYVLAIVGTAMLIPKDVEDRTLYTILSKPVPRFEYLLGKLLGMILLIFISLAVMDLLFCVLLKVREEMIVSEKLEMLELAADNRPGFAASEAFEAARDKAIESIRGLGLEWNLQNAVLSIFFKACVVAALTLLVSTFASTMIFTIILSLAIGIIAVGQGLARERLLGVPSHNPIEQMEIDKDVAEGYRMPLKEPDAGRKAVAYGLGLFFPDFALFDVKDGVAIGTRVPPDVMFKMLLITIYYVAVYYLVAVIVFWKKEL